MAEQSLNQKITFNSFIQTFGKGVALFLGILGLSLITRYLGPQKFGEYTIIIAFLQIFALLSDGGLALTAIQMISQPIPLEKKEKIFNNVFALKAISSFFFLSLAVICSFFFPYPLTVKIGILLFTLSFFFYGLIQILTVLFQYKLQMQKVVKAEIIGKIIFLLLVIMAIHFRLGLYGILAAGIGGAFLNFSLLWLAGKKIVKIKPDISLPEAKKIIEKTWPIALSVTFNLIYLKADTIILSLYYPPRTVGFYGISYKFFEILLTIPTMFMGLILPLLTKTWSENNQKHFQKIFSAAWQTAFIFALPTAIGLFILAKPLLILIAGKKFAPAAPLLKIISLSVAITFLSSLYGHTIVALNKQKQAIKIYLGGAILSLFTYFLLIPPFGAFGAAWSTAFIETFILIGCFFLIKNFTPSLPSFSFFFKTAAANFALILFLLFSPWQNIFFLICFGGLIYLSLLWALQVRPSFNFE